MQAKVVKKIDGIITVKIKRSGTTNELYGRHDDLFVGDTVECERKINNPYLVRTGKK